MKGWGVRFPFLLLSIKVFKVKDVEAGMREGKNIFDLPLLRPTVYK